MIVSNEVTAIIRRAEKLAEKKHLEFVTPEGLLLEMTFNDTFCAAFEEC